MTVNAGTLIANYRTIYEIYRNIIIIYNFSYWIYNFRDRLFIVQTESKTARIGIYFSG